jgi:HlyD family secretion protein
VNGPRVEDVLEARARLEGADARVVPSSRELERVSKLVEQKLLSPSSLDQQRATADTAQADRKQAAARLQALLAGTRIEQLDQARSALAAAEAQLKQLEVSAARMTVTAPRDGRVDALPYKLGERPPPGAPVVVMLADGAPYARVYVPEPVRARVVPGTVANVRVDGSDRTWRGRVRYVSAEAAFTPYYTLTQKDRSRLSFLAEVTLTDPEAQALPSGVPVEVRLELAAPK